MPKVERLTEFELDVLSARPSGNCQLVVNEEHFTRVVRDGMARARISLDIMTADFKAMLVPLGRKNARARSIIEVFRTLASRGVEIRILHAGTPSGPALQELKALGSPAAITIRRCPRLHAKAVIIDARDMYLGSANLTGAGLGAKSPHKRNFEIGLCTDSPSLIEAVSEQFNLLWEGRRCKSCRRKDICPVPLEEPRL